MFFPSYNKYEFGLKRVIFQSDGFQVTGKAAPNGLKETHVLLPRIRNYHHGEGRVRVFLFWRYLIGIDLVAGCTTYKKTACQSESEKTVTMCVADMS